MTRVLIVDDQPAFRHQFHLLLNAAGFEVVGEAGNISEALTLVQATKPDLAIIDVMLPDVDGIEGAPRLKALLPGLRLILISAYRDQSELFCKAAQEVGAEAFIAKDDLDVTTVRMWLHPHTPSYQERNNET